MRTHVATDKREDMIRRPETPIEPTAKTLTVVNPKQRLYQNSQGLANPVELNLFLEWLQSIALLHRKKNDFFITLARCDRSAMSGKRDVGVVHFYELVEFEFSTVENSTTTTKNTTVLYLVIAFELGVH